MMPDSAPARDSIRSGPASQRRRRPVVVTATAVLGAAVLGAGLQAAPGSWPFYVLTLLLAAVWITGSVLAHGSASFGHARRDNLLRDALLGTAVGAGLLVIFLAGASLVAQAELLAGPVERLLSNARWGALPLVAAITIINGVTEEIFFRGALYETVGGSAVRRIAVTTSIYTLVTAASGIALLAFAAFLLGIATGWLRHRTGALVAPWLAHLTWSLGMLLTLQPALDFWS